MCFISITHKIVLLKQIEIDADAPENQSPKAEVCVGEHIEQFIVKDEELLAFVEHKSQVEKMCVELCLYSFACARNLSKILDDNYDVAKSQTN